MRQYPRQASYTPQGVQGLKKDGGRVAGSGAAGLGWWGRQLGLAPIVGSLTQPTRAPAAKLEVLIVEHGGDLGGDPVAGSAGELSRRQPRGRVPDVGTQAGVLVGELSLQASLTASCHAGSESGCGGQGSLLARAAAV